MILNFYIRFYTKFGEALFVTGTGISLGSDDPGKAIPLKYLNHDFWHGQIELDNKDLELKQIRYNYIFRSENGEQVTEWESERFINLENINVKEISLIDTWNHAGTVENAFYTKPFQEVFLKAKQSFINFLNLLFVNRINVHVISLFLDLETN